MKRFWFVSLLLIFSSAFAQDCERGTLDVRFCDTDGDFLADVPTDESELADPDTIIFAYTPVEDPAVYAEVWADFLDHLADVTGKEVRFFPVDSNAAQLEAMRAGRLHVAGFNTGSVPFAVNVAGFRPFAMMAAADGSFGYEMEIIVPPSSDISSPGDLPGKQLAFTSETSNSGFKAPSAILAAEFDLTAGESFDTAFSGSHENSILGVVNGDYQAASIANSVLSRMIAREIISEDDFVSVYTSQTFPTTAYGYVHNLEPELAAAIQDAFFSYDWEGTALQEEFSESGEAQFMAIDYDSYWSVIRTIDEVNGVNYTAP
jgi:phosphonate transport system substrate-binding protein